MLVGTNLITKVAPYGQNCNANLQLPYTVTLYKDTLPFIHKKYMNVKFNVI